MQVSLRAWNMTRQEDHGRTAAALFLFGGLTLSEYFNQFIKPLNDELEKLLTHGGK